MARQREDVVYRPDLRARRAYDGLYPLYRKLAEGSGPVAAVMRELRSASVPMSSTMEEYAIIADADPREEEEE